jgi:hypothetical protein
MKFWVEESLLDIKLGGLYLTPWRVGAYLINQSSGLNLWQTLEEGETVVFLEIRETSKSFVAAYYDVKVLLSNSKIGIISCSETALMNYWKLVK